MRSYEISRVHVHEAVSTKGIVICLLSVDNPNIALHTRVQKKNGKGKRKWQLLV